MFCSGNLNRDLRYDVIKQSNGKIVITIIVKVLVTISIQEVIKLHCVFQGSDQKLQHNLSSSKARLVTTNYKLASEA